MVSLEKKCTNVKEGLSFEKDIVGYSSMSLSFTLSIHEKVEQRIKKNSEVFRLKVMSFPCQGLT